MPSHRRKRKGKEKHDLPNVDATLNERNVCKLAGNPDAVGSFVVVPQRWGLPYISQSEPEPLSSKGLIGGTDCFPSQSGTLAIVMASEAR